MTWLNSSRTDVHVATLDAFFSLLLEKKMNKNYEAISNDKLIKFVNIQPLIN